MSSFGAGGAAVAAEVGGIALRWHAVELRFDGPELSEDQFSPNPFLDYRLQCRFTGPSGQVYDVPGFFDGDGAGGAVGTVWKCRFAPDQAGSWQYVGSFREGPEIATSLDPAAGSATSFDGESGAFEVTESDKAAPDFRAPQYGVIRNDGTSYLHFPSGVRWIKTGSNIPENFLGYVGIDNTPNAVHHYSVHEADWRAGDPDWGNGAGRGIIGALNYLAAAGANGIYFLPMNIGGDGNETFPTIEPQDKLHYDTSKLLQWEVVFTHATSLGIFLHFQLAETEPGNELYHDGGELGPQRKLFYRELIARFGHHPGLEWDLGEENDYGTARRRAFAAYIRAVDPYDHPITNHTNYSQIEATYAPLLGDPGFDMTAIQYGPSGLEGVVSGWRQRSIDAGRPWVVSYDEPQVIFDDMNDLQRGYPAGRKNFLWPVFLSGGGGFELYVAVPGSSGGYDQSIDDFRPLQSALTWGRHVRAFLERLPLEQMIAADSGGCSACTVLAKVGEVYAIYRKSPASIAVDLSTAVGEFIYTWFEPTTGAWRQGGVVTGGGVRDLGTSPFVDDVAVAVMRRDVAASAGLCATDVDCETGDSCGTTFRCSEGICQPSGVVECDDGLYCNGVETCVDGGCVAGTPVACEDGLGCTVDRCDELLMACVHDVDDVLCDDSDPCTDDRCDPSAGCTWAYNAAPCDDGVACTDPDVCTDGVCAGIDTCPGDQTCELESGRCQSPPDPRVWIAAATDASAEFSGSMRAGLAYATGDDADPDADSLVGAVIAAGGDNDFSGTSGDAVTYTVELPEAGYWYAWGRFYYPGAPGSNDANSFFLSVDDGPAWNFGNHRENFQRWHWDGDGDSSVGGADPLALGLLEAGSHRITVRKREVVPVAPRLDVIALNVLPGAPADADAISGLSMGPTTTTTLTPPSTTLPAPTTTLPLPACATEGCDDGIACTVDVCDLALGTCRHVGDDSACDDGVACTIDLCDAAVGGCRSFADTGLCDDQNPCTSDVCTPGVGCVFLSRKGACDDGIACTLGDICFNGSCVGGDGCSFPLGCNEISGQCEEVPDLRVWIAAAVQPGARFFGAMKAGGEYSAGDDLDEAHDSLVGMAVYADSVDNDFGGATGDRVEYDVVLPADGVWYAWGRFYYPSDIGSSANSFSLVIDGGAPLKFGNNRELHQLWHWGGDGAVEVGRPVPLRLGFLPAGSHTVVVKKREVLPVPPRLDMLLLSMDPTEPPDADAAAALDAILATTTTTLAPTTTLLPTTTEAPTTSTTLLATTTTTVVPTTTTTLPPGCLADDDCDDGLYCNGAERCDGLGECIAGAAPQCDDGDPCTDDQCSEPDGCRFFYNSAPCNDAVACTIGDVCSDGMCAGVDACTDGRVCNFVTGACEDPPPPRVWVSAVVDPSAIFRGTMQVGFQYALGDDADPQADSLAGALVFAGGGNDFTASSGDEVSYVVDLPQAGTWYLWARMYFPGAPGSNEANSFTVRVDGGAPQVLGNKRDVFRLWHWDGDGSTESGARVALNLGALSAGPHELLVAKREVLPSAPRLDLLLLSTDPTAPTDGEALSALAALTTTSTLPMPSTTLPFLSVSTTLPAGSYKMPAPFVRMGVAGSAGFAPVR